MWWRWWRGGVGSGQKGPDTQCWSRKRKEGRRQGGGVTVQPRCPHRTAPSTNTSAAVQCLRWVLFFVISEVHLWSSCLCTWVWFKSCANSPGLPPNCSQRCSWTGHAGLVYWRLSVNWSTRNWPAGLTTPFQIYYSRLQTHIIIYSLNKVQIHMRSLSSMNVFH